MSWVCARPSSAGCKGRCLLLASLCLAFFIFPTTYTHAPIPPHSPNLHRMDIRKFFGKPAPAGAGAASSSSAAAAGGGGKKGSSSSSSSSKGPGVLQEQALQQLLLLLPMVMVVPTGGLSQ